MPHPLILIFPTFLIVLWALHSLWQRRGQEARVVPPKLLRGVRFATVLLAVYQLASCAVVRLQLADTRSIDARYMQFARALDEGRIDDAYQFMSPDYRRQQTLGDFENGLAREPIPDLRPLRSLRIWGNRAEL